MHEPHVLYVIADGGRARLVERAGESGDLVTFDQMARERPARLHGAPGRAFQSATPERHALGRDDSDRTAKEAFMGEIAERVRSACQARGVSTVWVAAPARLLSPLRRRLAEHRLETVPVRRDLTKTPDHELARWFNHLPPG